MSSSKDPLEPAVDLPRLRTEYSRKLLDEQGVDRDGWQRFVRWRNEALAAKVNEPNAMTLATTSSDGLPTARIVLLKGVDGGDLSFFTNYQSRKSQDLENNPRAALVFWWPELERQVRIEGTVRHTSERESDDYFNVRPPAARLGAAASAQSQPIASRDELQAIYNQLLKQYPQGNLPRPAHWGGYRVRPTRFEFWQGRPSRLHDRIEYILKDAGGWTIRRLAP